MTNILHLTTHLNIGGITSYIRFLTKEMQKMPYRFFIASSGGSQEQTVESQGVTCVNLPIRTKSELSPKLYWAIPKLLKIMRQNLSQLCLNYVLPNAGVCIELLREY